MALARALRAVRQIGGVQVNAAFQPGCLSRTPFRLWAPVVGREQGRPALERLTAGEVSARPGYRGWLERDGAHPFCRIVLFPSVLSEAVPSFPALGGDRVGMTIPATLPGAVC